MLFRSAGDGDGTAVLCYLRDRMYGFCGRMALVAVLHSGIWAGNWADIDAIRPTHVTALARAHRQTRFDLFHSASPQPADAGFLGRSLPNVHLNSCWSHLLSPNLTLQAWDMWLDMLPINRVMAWGGTTGGRTYGECLTRSGRCWRSCWRAGSRGATSGKRGRWRSPVGGCTTTPGRSISWTADPSNRTEVGTDRWVAR